MKQIDLNHGKFALVDDEDFEFINQWRWHFSKGYAKRAENYIYEGKRKQNAFLMHRVINKTPQGMDTDHINMERLDNRKSNLRTASRTQNLINKTLIKSNTSGVKGVSWHKRIKAWHAHISGISLGYYENIEDAKTARNKVEKFLYGDFSRVGVS